MTQRPWGRMFYDLIRLQLDVPTNPRLRVLDFGSGFGITADHYAKFHDVTAVEPNADMLSLRSAANAYMQIFGGIEALTGLDGQFDLVLCHNVLEYAPNRGEIISALSRALTPTGMLSVIKHNLYGKVMAAAVFEENPAKAAELLDGTFTEKSRYFGDGQMQVYSENDLLNMAANSGLTLEAHYGIRTFFALTQNNDVKYKEEWYKPMLDLEYKVCNIDEFRRIAASNHYIFKNTPRTYERLLFENDVRFLKQFS